MVPGPPSGHRGTADQHAGHGAGCEVGIGFRLRRRNKLVSASTTAALLQFGEYGLRPLAVAVIDESVSRMLAVRRRSVDGARTEQPMRAGEMMTASVCSSCVGRLEVGGRSLAPSGAERDGGSRRQVEPT